ncbi:hypothetical protein AB4Y32_29075 [Paraburkholderia phymatum]|uniref:Uncharacterized protein n=1 Tax=Paraburkholderia phymatum TaxID=148447 RepID=A0ACC6U8D3_9BURK
MESTQPVDGSFKSQFATRELELLHEADDKCDLPPLGGPIGIKSAPLRSQPSPDLRPERYRVGRRSRSSPASCLAL